ncbi:MAG: hypothetical protein VCA35_15100, partial [Roseibacillus sp.]
MGQARDALANEMDGPVDRDEAEDGGPPGICFRVEVTSNLRDWTTVFCLISIDGTIHFVGERVPGLPHRFFRIAEEPDGLRRE